jgi:hypothetical protein
MQNENIVTAAKFYLILFAIIFFSGSLVWSYELLLMSNALVLYVVL